MSDGREPAGSPGGPEGLALPEGEEPAPRGTRAAALVRWSIVGLMALAAGGAWVYHLATSGVVAERAVYVCPMHPSIVSERKGECPICGMDLVVGAKGAPSAPSASAPAPASAGEGGVAAHAEYTCPMHPGFVTLDPKARCPECGMKLVPRSADAPSEGAAPAAGVPGLAPVELSAERIQLIGMKTAVAARERLSPTIRTAGFVAPSEKGLVSVNLRFPAWIEALRAGDVGQLVEKGEVLATVYSPGALAAQQQFLTSTRWSEGSAPAQPPPAQSGAQGEAIREAWRRLELFGLAREDIEALVASGKPSSTVNVRAPVRGHVAKRAALRGVYVQPGTEIFQIADLSTVWVIADVHESEIGRVKVGQRASLSLGAYPGERFAGRITFVYPALAVGSRTLQARIELANPGLRLRPGMFADVTLDLGAAEALVVPVDALVDTGEAQYVFVSRGSGRFEPRRVRAGWSGEGKVAVLEGLAEGERVVTTANFLLDSESRLRAALEGFAPR
jgi:Cu(I)/Ag(I) efflux system membrane fusion protein